MREIEAKNTEHLQIVQAKFALGPEHKSPTPADAFEMGPMLPADRLYRFATAPIPKKLDEIKNEQGQIEAIIQLIQADPQLFINLEKSPGNLLARTLARVAHYEVNDNSDTNIATHTKYLLGLIERHQLYDALLQPCDADGLIVMHYVARGSNPRIARMMIEAFAAHAPWSQLCDIQYWQRRLLGRKNHKPVDLAKGEIAECLRTIETQGKATLLDFYRYYERMLKENTLKPEKFAKRYVALTEIFRVLCDNQLEVQRKEGDKTWNISIHGIIYHLEKELRGSDQPTGHSCANILAGLYKYTSQELLQQARDLRGYLQKYNPNRWQVFSKQLGLSVAPGAAAAAAGADGASAGPAYRHPAGASAAALGAAAAAAASVAAAPAATAAAAASSRAAP